MEFFAKAHVAKEKQSREGDRNEEKVKQQIKQMLFGYRQSDNDLIKSCAKDTTDLDTSSSVSGFSDLEITSSNEDNSTVNDKSMDFSQIVDGVSTLDSSTECNDGLKSLSEGSLHESNSSIHESDFNTSSGSSVTSSETDSNDQHFDRDGTLAFTILRKLGKVKQQDDSRQSKRLKISMRSSNDELTPSKKNLHCYANNYQMSNISTSSLESDLDSEDAKIDSSQKYVSVNVSDMHMESLSAIIGDYKHPTVKNLPYESLGFCTENSGMFEIDTVSNAELNEMNVVEEHTTSIETEDISEMNIAVQDLILSSQEPDESTSIYDNTLQSENSAREMSPDSVEMPIAFVSPVIVYFANDSVIVIMRHPSEFFIHGKVKVTALGGKVEIFGYTLQNKHCVVYAPRYNFAQSVRTVNGENEYYGLFSKLTKAGLTVSVAEDILTTIGPEDAVLHLQQMKSNKLEFVENNFDAADLFTKTNKNIDECFKKASEVLGCSLYLTRPWRCFEVNPSWPDVIKCGFDKGSKGIICGAKGLGKSNFLRYYVNNLLSQGPVLVIDLDPGKAEFSVAGNVSATVVTEPLLGPAFTHLKTPEMMYNIGMINTMDNPDRFIAAVDLLIEDCLMKENLQEMPWVVNTMGMVNAMGLKFMSYIILKIRPTFVFQIDSKNPKKRFEIHLASKEVTELFKNKYSHNRLFTTVTCEELKYKFILSSFAEITIKNNNSLAARDERYLNFLAYFSKLITNRNKHGLLEIVPYVVNLKDFNIFLNVRIDKDSVCEVLNGKVVALCEDELYHKTGNVFTLNDKPLLCHGHGLIRGIDTETYKLYIVTVVPINLLAKVNCFVYADWVPEISGQEKYLPEGIKIPYRTSTEYQQRQLMFAPKRRFNPVQLIKMTRKT